MIELAKGPDRRRQEVFRETSRKMGVHEAIIEKDFWVCLILRILFSSTRWGDKIVFKGGTSLSKVYGAIARFSEDIDIILDWRELGYSKDDPWLPESTAKKDQFVKKTTPRTRQFLHEIFTPSLQELCARDLGPTLTILADNDIVKVEYPRAFDNPSILPYIILEIGPLAAWTPQKPATITPYAAEQYPKVFSTSTCDLQVVTAERTFWEKATILHQEFHRPDSKPMPGRYSRHYYDVFKMAQASIADAALEQIDLLPRVVEFKERFYKSSWSNLLNACPGSFRLVPPAVRIPALVQDYASMSAMFFHEEPTFDAILDALGNLESRINALGFQNKDSTP
ncbi:MAG: nucleotidyl transferase AbiEii/AbiGii toxin family protein [Spirochaetia bacterium]|jgi:predicted nucleotidyltransferase component of viral defense system|nr:nucleotidyl transferase AbiEii/AbiGii toxin family protein [Spirochaetia bacterium]